LIGVPVLAGSAAYGLALVIQYTPVDPMKALFWSAVINGVVAVPLMAVIIVLASKRSVMGEYTASRTLQVLGWIGTGVMGLAAAAMLLPSGG
jgi:Mn2+/Fe2+ NRAMP family transporter